MQSGVLVLSKTRPSGWQAALKGVRSSSVPDGRLGRHYLCDGFGNVRDDESPAAKFCEVLPVATATLGDERHEGLGGDGGLSSC